jgi:hypothetical protein
MGNKKVAVEKNVVVVISLDLHVVVLKNTVVVVV